MIFTFSRQAGASKFDEWCRLYNELLDPVDFISHSHNGDRLASLLDVSSDPTLPVGYIGGKAVNDVSAWATNCAELQHAAMVWMKRDMKPYVNGEPISSYIELVKGDAIWVPNDGTNEPDDKACVFYVDPSTTFKYDHVGAFGIKLGPRHYASYEGGGGDGTRVGKSDRLLDVADRFGRRIPGWWVIDSLIPDFDVFVENDTPNDGDDVAPS